MRIFLVFSIISFGFGHSYSSPLELDVYKSFIFNDITILNKSLDSEHALSIKKILQKMVMPNTANSPELMVESWFQQLDQQGDPLTGFRFPFYNQLLKDWPRSASGEIELNRRSFALNAVINRLDGLQDFTTNFSPQLRLEYQLFDKIDSFRPFYQALYIIEISLSPKVANSQVLIEMAKRWADLSRSSYSQEEIEKKLVQLVDRWIELWLQDTTANVSMNSMDFLDQFNINFGSYCLKHNATVVPCNSHMMLGGNLGISGNEDLKDWFLKNWEDYFQLDGTFSPIPLPVELRGHKGQYTLNLERLLPEFIKDPSDELRLARKNFTLNTCVGCHNATERNNNENLMMLERFSFDRYSAPTIFVEKHEIPKRVEFMATLLKAPVSIKNNAQAENKFECAKFKSELGPGYTKNYLLVPEDYSKPNGDKIKVFYYSRLVPGRIPVAFINDEGNPTLNRLPLLEEIENRYNLNFIFMDQRGHGCSGVAVDAINTNAARKASLYSSENIVRDYELLRKKLIGENRKWAIFGHGSGGTVVERYIIEAAESLVSASTYAGVAEETMVNKLKESMIAQIQTRQFVFSLFGESDSFIEIVKKIKPTDCFKLDTNQKICGVGVLALLQRTFLASPQSWKKFTQILSTASNCPDDRCLFDSKGNLNFLFWDYISSNIFPNFEFVNHMQIMKLFFQQPGNLMALLASLRQDYVFLSPNRPSMANECREAIGQLRASGRFNSDELAVTDCDFLTQIFEEPWQKNAAQTIFTKIPAKNPILAANLDRQLNKNKKLKYYIYSAKADYFSGYENVQGLRDLISANVIYSETKGNGRRGFVSKAEIWQNISGQKDRTISSDAISLDFSDGFSNSQIFEGRAAENTAVIKELPIEKRKARLVYVGTLADPLSEELKGKIPGSFVLVDRGLIGLVKKIEIAVQAGATGVVIVNNEIFPGDPFRIANQKLIDIPAMMISTADGQKLKAILNSKPDLQLVFEYLP